MFKIAVNNLVRSIGDDVYLPSPSTAASKNLSPLSLVEREGSVLPFTHCNDYYTTDFTLDDVLVDKDVEFEIVPDQPFCTFNRESTMKVDGSLQGSLKEIFDAGIQKVDSVTIKAEIGQLSISEVSMQSLLKDLHKRKLNMNHGLVRELSRKKRRALCIVTGVVKTTTETDVTTEVHQSHDVNAQDSEGSEVDETDVGKIPLKSTSREVFDQELKAVHVKNSTRSLHLPAGTVLAYQIMELAVSDSGTVRLMVSHGAKGGFHIKGLEKKTSTKPLVSPKKVSRTG